MSRSRLSRLMGAVVAAGLLITITACGKSGPETTGGATPTGSATASSTPPASPSASPSPTAPATDPATVLAADGIGPYIVGTALSDLKARALLTNIVESPFCADAFGADATGVYSGKVTVSFRHGLLTAVHTTSNSFVTPSGARVGISLTELQGIYGAKGTLLTGTLGNKAMSVRVPASGLAVVFFLDPTLTKVDAISGGEARALEDAVHSGEGC